MEKMEILQHVANSHNRLMQIIVSGDNAILMGEALKNLRFLAQSLQNDIEATEAEIAIDEDKE